jgi:hypothetical protein
MVMDHQLDKWKRRIPGQWEIDPALPWPNNDPIPWLPAENPSPITPIKPITQEEIDEFRELLERAREYDRRNNEPDCEMESKKEALLKIAEALGVKIDFL